MLKNSRKRVFLVDDHVMFLDGLESILVHHNRVTVEHVFDNANDLLVTLETDVPDLIIADISLKDMNGLELARVISEKYSQVKLILLTMHDEPSKVLAAMDLGVQGYVLKDSGMDELFKAIDQVLSGHAYFSSVVKKVLTFYNGQETEPLLSITSREKEILKLVSDGYSTRDIANLLQLSEKTVETHRKNMLVRTGSKNSLELVNKARMLKLI